MGAEVQTLLPIAEKIAVKLIARRENVAIAESSAGGLISAALLAVPGASAYFLGGGVIYTANARAGLLGIRPEDISSMRPSTEDYAAYLARRVSERLGAVWGVGETGATGPTGNRYGDAAGHVCIAVSGPREFAFTLETASADRQANMRAFAKAALEAFLQTLEAADLPKT